MKHPSTYSTLRFLIPLSLENAATTFISMAFTALLGGVSPNALASLGVVNSLLNFFLAVLSMLTTGPAVLTARLVGEGDRDNTSLVVEQTLILTAGMTVLLSFLTMVFTRPIAHLLMPNAEMDFFESTVDFLRILMVSFPFWMLYNATVSILRAAGLSQFAFISSLVMNLSQLALSFVLIALCGLDLLGAALAILGCRLIGFGLSLCFALQSRACFSLRLRGLLRPDRHTLLRIIRTGFPMTLDQFSVQGGYLVANSMMVGLGTFSASIYQIATTLFTFPQLPMGVSCNATLTLVGQALGSGDLKRAKRLAWQAQFWSMVISMSVLLAIEFLGQKATALFSNDPSVILESARLLPHFVATGILSSLINSADNVLRVGGYTRYVMLYTIIGVWVFRLPLTYLFCYCWDWGIIGVLWANNFNLLFRAVAAVSGVLRGKWLYGKLS